METLAHLHLKQLAVTYLRQRGCCIHAHEVRSPIARFRVDVAGYQDRVPDPHSQTGFVRCQPRTIVIECKQSRSDFLRDTCHGHELLELRQKYDRIRQSIEEHRIKRYEPHLQCHGSSLFGALDDWRVQCSRLPGYRKVLRRLRVLDEKLHGQTKFFQLSRYRVCDEMYLAAPAGLVRSTELPPGWGLLESEPDHASLTVRVRSHDFLPKPTYQQRWLRNIAVAASRRV